MSIYKTASALLASGLILSVAGNLLQRGLRSRDIASHADTRKEILTLRRLYQEVRLRNVELKFLSSQTASGILPPHSPLPSDSQPLASPQSPASPKSSTTSATSEPSVSPSVSGTPWTSLSQDQVREVIARHYTSPPTRPESSTNSPRRLTCQCKPFCHYSCRTDSNTSHVNYGPLKMHQPLSNPPHS